MRLRRACSPARASRGSAAARDSPTRGPTESRSTTTGADRIKELVIPPAWKKVWISPHANGHIQAVGTDVAGRRQYLYHQAWQEERAEEKFDRVLEMSRGCPPGARRSPRTSRAGA